MTTNGNASRANSSLNSLAGYSAVRTDGRSKEADWCWPDGGDRKRQTKGRAGDPKGRLVALFGAQDEFVATFHHGAVQVMPFAAFQEGGKEDVLVRVKLGFSAVKVTTAGRRRPLELLAIDEEGVLWSLDFTPHKDCPAKGGLSQEPRCKELAGSKDAPIRAAVPLRHQVVLQTRERGVAGYRLHSLDRKTARVSPIGSFQLDGDIAALEPDRHDILLGREKGEQRLILFGEASETGQPEVRAFDMPRVSAVSVVDGQYLVVARKGGLVDKVDLRAAVPDVAARAVDPLARICYILRQLLKRCGCSCDDKPGGGDPDRPGDDDDRPGGGDRPDDDEPCGDRHSAQLSWTPKILSRVGAHVVATAHDGTRMAVLDRRLNLIFERKLDRRGASILTGRAHTQNMLVHIPRQAQLEAWHLADFVAEFHGRRPDGLILTPRRPEPSITFYGQKHQRASPNPHLNICIFTVTEPGQNFGDSDQTELMDQVEANIFETVNSYYEENSFGDLSLNFTVFGHDIGGMRAPLVLPRAIASYFRDAFRAGGLEAVMPADWSDPVVFDGTEELEIQANPRAGAVKTYDIPFAAMWTSGSFNSYPVEIEFDGTETLELTVETQDGDNHVLNLTFPALSLSHDQGDDEAAFLAAVGDHITDAIRAAEAGLPGNPTLIQDVVFRRVRTSSSDSNFGRLQGMFRSQAVAAGDFVQKGQVSITGPALPAPVLSSMGLSSAHVTGVMFSETNVFDYFRQCLRATQSDAGEGPGQSTEYFSTSVSTDEDAAAQEITVGINLTTDTGGVMSTIEVLSSSGLSGTGWDTASPNPGSESDSNNDNTLRDSIDLANDTFTVAMAHLRNSGPWVRAAVEATFADFDVMMIGFVGAPPASVPVADRWDAEDPDDFSRLRMFARRTFARDLNPPNGEDPVQMGTDRVIGQKFSSFSSGTMTHEIAHALGLPDLYSADGYRDDVLYIDDWGMMAGGNDNFHHLCGWSKWFLGWIPEDSDPELNRVIDVDLPDPSGVSVTEAWLVPVEYWDNAMHDDVRDEVGGSVPIGQLMKLNLGSDGGVLNFLELRAEGDLFSQNLSPEPSVIATNGLDPNSDRHWAVNGLYRRSLHLLNQGTELRATNDTWSFAQAVEFPLTGCTVEVADTRTIRGSIPIFRLRVEREAADYIDLHFQDHVPSYKSPDIWVDWPVDNADPSEPRIYPVGTPTDQGETVRFPTDSSTEKHFVVARVHNAGTARAEEVKVRWFVCDPPGAGDDGRWVDRGTIEIPEVAAGGNEIAAFDWQVDSSTNVHQCMRMEIIDWTIPSEVDPATGDTVHLASDDVKLQNNNAQQNVFDFEALTGSPYPPIQFQMQVHNDRVRTEIAALVPKGLPYGSKLEISPAEAAIPSGTARIFNCTLQLDEDVIRPGCDNDSGFLLTAWRRDDEADEIWGSCFYHVRPRWKTSIEVLYGTWFNGQVSVYGRLHILTSEGISVDENLPLFARIRLVIMDGGGGAGRVEWRTVAINGDGSFHLQTGPESGVAMRVQAWFDRTDNLGSSVSNQVEFKHSVLE